MGEEGFERSSGFFIDLHCTRRGVVELSVLLKHRGARGVGEIRWGGL
jgi:hypothetical protein